MPYNEEFHILGTFASFFIKSQLTVDCVFQFRNCLPMSPVGQMGLQFFSVLRDQSFVQKSKP